MTVFDPGFNEVEVWAGKNEIKDKYRLRTFDEFEAGIGDVVTDALKAIKYLNDWQTDGNVSRQMLHPLWIEAQKVASNKIKLQ